MVLHEYIIAEYLCNQPGKVQRIEEYNIAYQVNSFGPLFLYQHDWTFGALFSTP